VRHPTICLFPTFTFSLEFGDGCGLASIRRALALLFPNVRASLVSPASCSRRTGARAGEADTSAVECSSGRQRTPGVCSCSLLMRSHHRSHRRVSSQAPRKHDAHASSMAGEATHPRNDSGAALSSMRNHQRVFDSDDRYADYMLPFSRPFPVSLGDALSSVHTYPHRVPTFPVVEEGARYGAPAQSRRQGWQHKYPAPMLFGHRLRCCQIPPWILLTIMTPFPWIHTITSPANISIPPTSINSGCPLIVMA
jgi:hypothetical protein